VDLFRIGLGFILLGALFPLVDFISKYVSEGTAMATLVTWVIGIALILVSAFIRERMVEK